MNKTERLWHYMNKIIEALDTLGIPREIPKGSFYDVTADTIARINKFLQNPLFFLETNNRPKIRQIRAWNSPKCPSFVIEIESAQT